MLEKPNWGQDVFDPKVGEIWISPIYDYNRKVSYHHFLVVCVNKDSTYIKWLGKLPFFTNKKEDRFTRNFSGMFWRV